jgi:S1-C subfamily serine protease
MSMEDYYRRDRPRSSFAGAGLPFLLLLLLIGAVIWRFWPWQPSGGLDPNAIARPVVARGDLAEEEKATIELYRRNAPSVVHVTRLSEERDLYSLDIMQIPSGTGSGFVWDSDGHVVTNNHVVQGASAFQVILADHSKWNASVVGTDQQTDVAVLKIDAPKDRLHPIMVGSSHDLQVGQKAYAIGNPFGLDQSLTTGVVSALDRDIPGTTLKGAIQTNAAINPGNSGGPLLDSAGRLIGINTAIVSPSGASAGIGFAIPVDEVNRIAPQLIRLGKVPRPGLGVRLASDQLNQRFGIEQGVLIIDVVPNSPAAAAGLRSTRRVGGRWQLGDIILAADGKPVNSVKDLYNILEPHKAGDTVTVTISRDGEEMQVPITLQPIR